MSNSSSGSYDETTWANYLAVVVFDQESDIIWMNQFYNCGDGVIIVGETVGDVGDVVGQC